MDTRRYYQEIAGRLEFRSGRALAKVAACVVIAFAGAYLPEHAGLGEAGRASLWILLLAAGLWVSEAVPAFAVALVVIGLQVLILGRPGGVLADPDQVDAWQVYTAPWAAPPMWLFLAGLVLARAAERTGLARWMAQHALALTGGRGPLVLLAAMGVTLVFSMFISNTATAALMVAMLGPVLAVGRGAGERTRAGLLVGVAFAANIGGMATIIGTPPNAIAVGLLASVHDIGFLDWMLLGAPPAMLLAAGLAVALGLRQQRAGADFLETGAAPAAVISTDAGAAPEDPAAVALWQKLAVMSIFTVTVVLWLSEPWHGLPTAVVAFLSIVALAAVGVIRSQDMRALPWDILILLAGGLSLGVGVAESGLARWLAQGIAEVPAAPWALALGLCYLTGLLSNLMSNTAAANLILPVAIALGLEIGGPVLAAQFAVPIALSASSAMCLAISTPPNAIVYATGRLGSRDLLAGGLAVGAVAPPIAVAWCFPMVAWLSG